MVRAISSAMDSSVFLNSSNPIGSESAVAMAQTSITMLPEASSRRGRPGGTTHVASYSSITAGPSRGVARSARDRIGVVSHPACGPK
jgi:hypothetical protein